MSKITISRTIRPYIVFHSICTYAYQDANSTIKGRFLNCLTSMVFCAFTLEGYLNHLGEILFPKEWKLFNAGAKRKDTKEKLNVICEKFHYSLNKNVKPFCYSHTIFGFRDEIVHPKTFNKEVVKYYSLKPDQKPKLPKPECEKMANLDNCKIFLEKTEEMISIIHEKSGQQGYAFTSPYFESIFIDG